MANQDPCVPAGMPTVLPWEERGGSGVFVNLDGTGGFNDTYICEIPAKQSLNPIKHIYDELIFVLRGR